MSGLAQGVSPTVSCACQGPGGKSVVSLFQFIKVNWHQQAPWGVLTHQVHFRANLLGAEPSGAGPLCLSSKVPPLSASLISSLGLHDKPLYTCACVCSLCSSDSYSYSNTCDYVTQTTLWPQDPMQTHPEAFSPCTFQWLVFSSLPASCYSRPHCQAARTQGNRPWCTACFCEPWVMAKATVSGLCTCECHLALLF